MNYSIAYGKKQIDFKFPDGFKVTIVSPKLKTSVNNIKSRIEDALLHPINSKSLSELAKGKNYIETNVYTAEEDAEILKLYEGLRVADVSDGLDKVGLPGTGLVDPAIHADWKDFQDLSHVFRGIAVTVRYVPTQRKPFPEYSDDLLRGFDTRLRRLYFRWLRRAWIHPSDLYRLIRLPTRSF